MSIVNDIKGLPNIPWGLELPCGLCADKMEFFCAISLVYVQIPVIIELFSFFFHKCEEFHKGEGVKGVPVDTSVRLRAHGKPYLCIFIKSTCIFIKIR